MTGKTDRIRTRVCITCEKSFSYKIGKGNDRKHCSDVCREKYKKARVRPRSEWNKCNCGAVARSQNGTLCYRCYGIKQKELAGLCTVHKCDKPALRSKRTLCEMHYYRLRRNGTLNNVRRTMGIYTDGRGYVHAWKPGHTLSKKSGYVSKHRQVLFDSIGEGRHECHWCGIDICWSSMHVDHLDSDKENNDITNLVASCPNCNQARGAAEHLLARMKPEAVDQFLYYLGLRLDGQSIVPRTGQEVVQVQEMEGDQARSVCNATNVRVS